MQELCAEELEELVFNWCWFIIQLSVVLKVVPGMEKYGTFQASRHSLKRSYYLLDGGRCLELC